MGLVTMPQILVLEDDVLISMLLEEWLTELGCATAGPANSIAAALSLIEATALDGAILDVSVGSENSYPVAAALRDRGVPFAFATGRLGEEIDGRFKQTAILGKPFDFEAVKGAVAKLLERCARPL